MSVNLNGVFYSTRAEIGPMRERGGGPTVNMASILGAVGFANSVAYVAAKHGVVGLTQNAALKQRRRRVPTLIFAGSSRATRRHPAQRLAPGRHHFPRFAAWTSAQRLRAS